MTDRAAFPDDSAPRVSGTSGFSAILASLFERDKLMRLPIVLFTGFFLVREILLLNEFLDRHPIQIEIQFLANLGARISLILFLVLLIGLHLGRSRPVNKAAGLQPKLSALIGLTIGNLILLLDKAEPAPLYDLMSAGLLLFGNYLCIVVLLHLGRSVSIMAEARRLVTSGPYALIRHPLYFAEEIATLGIFLQFRSWQAAAILVVHFGFQVMRMFNEERVLRATFPEYHGYMQSTARLIPGVW
ncbi:MAG TPA: isoprenylcysteine carboxylmethyltransferase family protein [Gallionella sp.]|nr:isoprenylcysteine carboxylmethyltransferase family protein [Gallionella sp.]